MIKQIAKYFFHKRDAAKNKNAKFYGGPEILKATIKNCTDKRQGIYSQAGQDLILLELLGQYISEGKIPKVFMDIGCNHPIQYSNSLFFEKYMGFQTIAVDAMAEFGPKWKSQRPQAIFVNSAVGDRTGTVQFEVAHGENNEDMFSAISGSSEKLDNLHTTKRTVKIETITKILKSLNIKEVGILGLDVEGNEHSALLGLDLNSIKVSAAIVENNSEKGLPSSVIREYFQMNNYVLAGRVFNLDDIFIHKDLIAKNI